MSVERAIHCDGPDCERFVRTNQPPPYVPDGFIEVRQGATVGDSEDHFCGWDCVLKFAATFEPEEIVE